MCFIIIFINFNNAAILLDMVLLFHLCTCTKNPQSLANIGNLLIGWSCISFLVYVKYRSFFIFSFYNSSQNPQLKKNIAHYQIIGSNVDGPINGLRVGVISFKFFLEKRLFELALQNLLYTFYNKKVEHKKVENQYRFFKKNKKIPRQIYKLFHMK